MISIEPLAHHMNLIPALADIWCDVLGRVWIPSIAVDDVKRWMNAWHETDKLPTAHVALDKQIPVGVCALQRTDGILPELSPWLTDLCVAQQYQNQGIGSLLVTATKKKARELSFDKLHLFTFDKQLVPYYERADFSVIGSNSHRGLPVTVMVSAV